MNMIAKNAALATAWQDLTDLKTLKIQFLEAISRGDVTGLPYGGWAKLVVSNSRLSGEAFEKAIGCEPRVVAINGRPSALELSFTTMHKDEPLVFLSLYLQKNGLVTFDDQGSQTFAEWRAGDFYRNLLTEISTSLLKSPAYERRA